MKSAFDTLGIPQGLVVDESALAAAFREARDAGVEAWALGCTLTAEGINADRLIEIIDPVPQGVSSGMP